MTNTHDPFTGPGPHVAPDGAAAGETGPDGLNALPGWLRRAVLSWGVRRSPASWVGGVLGGVPSATASTRCSPAACSSPCA